MVLILLQVLTQMCLPIAEAYFKANQGKIALPEIRNDDDPWNVPNTLDLTINGNGATFIRASSEEFRFIYMHLYTVVEINGITFRNGLGKHRGGAIFFRLANPTQS